MNFLSHTMEWIRVYKWLKEANWHFFFLSILSGSTALSFLFSGVVSSLSFYYQELPVVWLKMFEAIFNMELWKLSCRIFFFCNKILYINLTGHFLHFKGGEAIPPQILNKQTDTL